LLCPTCLLFFLLGFTTLYPTYTTYATFNYIVLDRRLGRTKWNPTPFKALRFNPKTNWWVSCPGNCSRFALPDLLTFLFVGFHYALPNLPNLHNF